MTLTPTDDRTTLYMRFCVEQGMKERYGEQWETPQRVERLERELGVIEGCGFSPYFLILTQIMEFCRRENIPYGAGRGSIGGSLVGYALGIHEVDSLEFNLLFERFLTRDRIGWPDVDIDVSKRYRQRVLDFIRDTFGNDDTVVLQVGAFARAGPRTVIEMMFSAHQDDPTAAATAENLRKCLPEGVIASGMKQDRELAWWLDADPGNGSSQERFVKIAKQAGWLETMLMLDCIQTHLAKHAAGVVILSREDLKRLPLCGARDSETGEWRMMTGYDMYSLDALSYLKIDILGLRTLDMLSDAHQFMGGSGGTRDMMALWSEHREESHVYELLSSGDTLGVFQMETSGYRRVLKDFQPKTFEHIVQLGALYRPGALGFKREDGMNMVQVFIERRHGREMVTYANQQLHDVLEPILRETQGVIVYQEQAMQIAKVMAGFDDIQADTLRKAIGKKLSVVMAKVKDEFILGCMLNGIDIDNAEYVFTNIEAAERYSFNKAHSVEYGILTWLSAFFKSTAKPAFYTALINSWSETAERQSEVVAEARQHCTIIPPDVNIALAEYTVDEDRIVFGLNGIKGMGEANRSEILGERFIYGPFKNFEEFHRRLPSVPINMKLSLIRCGAFDSLDDRTALLSTVTVFVPRTPEKPWVGTVAEFVKDNASRKHKRELPPIYEWKMPSLQEMAESELATIGFYVSSDPMSDVSAALRRLDKTMHWGGTIETVRLKKDRKNNEMAMATLLTTGLIKLRLVIFASIFPRVESLLVKGARVIVRGRMDGSQLLVDGLFAAGDYRHFRLLKATKEGETEIKERFDGKLSTIEAYEAAGYFVRLL